MQFVEPKNVGKDENIDLLIFIKKILLLSLWSNSLQMFKITIIISLDLVSL